MESVVANSRRTVDRDAARGARKRKKRQSNYRRGGSAQPGFDGRQELKPGTYRVTADDSKVTLTLDGKVVAEAPVQWKDETNKPQVFADCDHRRSSEGNSFRRQNALRRNHRVVSSGWGCAGDPSCRAPAAFQRCERSLRTASSIRISSSFRVRVTRPVSVLSEITACAGAAGRSRCAAAP